MFSEIELEFKSGNYVLFGTLCTPDDIDRPPLVLFVHGSGPTDRDENSKFGKLNIFNALAHQLARNGIASFRYDKRGCGKSEGKFNVTGHFELVDDAEAALGYLKNNSPTPLGKMFINGHSEGTIIAPQIANRRNDVDGIILMSPFLKPLDEVMLLQGQAIAEEIKNLPGFTGKIARFITGLQGGVLKQQKRVIEKLKNSTTDSIRVTFSAMPARWFRELFSLEPKEIYQAVSTPTLIIAGEKDLQCAPEDAREISEIISAPTRLHVIDDLTHILRLDPETPTLLNYKKLMKLPINDAIAPIMSTWIDMQD